MAQAPAPAPKPADVQAEIKKLMAEDPLAALEKAKTLIPAEKPAFDKTTTQTAMKSLDAWGGVLEYYSLAFDAAGEAGRYEVAKEMAEKARDMAKEMQAEAIMPFMAVKKVWSKASEDATKALARIEELKGKEQKAKELLATDPKGKDLKIKEKAKELYSPAEEQELADLIANEATFKTNISNAKVVHGQVDKNLRILNDQVKGYDKPLEQISNRIKDEQDELMKFKGNKVTFAKAVYNTVGTKPTDMKNALIALRRAAFLDPTNKLIPHRIDVLMGKAVEAPAKPVKKAGARKKGA
jgi:hypothetical protein